MGCSDVAGGDSGSFHLVTEVDEPADNDVQAPPNESLHVLDEDAARAELGDDAVELVPEAGAGAFEAGTTAGEGDVLARKPAAHHVNGRQDFGADLSDIFVPHDVGPVFR